MKKKNVSKTDKNNKNFKTGYYLKEILGLLKDDKEYDIIQKELKKYWRKWTMKYVN